MELNTLFQLYAMRVHGDPQLDMASRLLLMPDLLHYWMTGEQVAEYTIASTTQMLHAQERRWATGLLAKLGLPTAHPAADCRAGHGARPAAALCGRRGRLLRERAGHRRWQPRHGQRRGRRARSGRRTASI